MKAIDIIGQRFGRLTVISRNMEQQKAYHEKTGQYKAFWNCKCDCGNECVVSGSNLKSKTSTSCGCYRQEVNHRQKNTKNIEWIVDGDITTGITNQGERFIIDTEDLDKVKDYCWHISSKKYVIANMKDKSNKTIWLHRLIMDARENEIVDHVDWDKSDNRKSNLRVATKSQNNINIKRKSNNRSGYTGVKMAKSGKYIAQITANKHRIHLGTFDTLQEAVEARRVAEIQCHKEFDGEINRQDYNRIMQEDVGCQLHTQP